jgi:hypothetical protein
MGCIDLLHQPKKRLKDCIRQIREQLNRFRECAITIDGQEANPIFLRLDNDSTQLELDTITCQYLSLYGSCGSRAQSSRKSLVIAAPTQHSVPLLDIKVGINVIQLITTIIDDADTDA